MTDDLVDRLRRFRQGLFPRYRREYRRLVAEGQHPSTLFIGCSDSRLVPYLLTGSGPGELFIVRNVGNLIPPWDASHGYHGTTAAIDAARFSAGTPKLAANPATISSRVRRPSHWARSMPTGRSILPAKRRPSTCRNRAN